MSVSYTHLDVYKRQVLGVVALLAIFARANEQHHTNNAEVLFRFHKMVFLEL